MKAADIIRAVGDVKRHVPTMAMCNCVALVCDHNPAYPAGDDTEFIINGCESEDEVCRLLFVAIASWAHRKTGSLWERVPPDAELCGPNGSCPGKWRAYARLRFIGG